MAQVSSILPKLGGLGKRIPKNGSGNGADRILDKLFRLHRAEKLTENSFYIMLEELLRVAEPRHADRVAEILSWDILFVILRRRTRIALVSILIRIGRREHIPALQAYRARLSEILYPDESWKSFSAGPIAVSPDFLRYLDKEDIRAAIAACEAREYIPDQ